MALWAGWFISNLIGRMVVGLLPSSHLGERLMKSLRVFFGVIVGLALAFSGVHAVVAQEVTATITGTATDPSGAAIVGAKVTAKSVERGITFSAVTNDSGIYRISQLPVGSYELRAEKDGFQTS